MRSIDPAKGIRVLLNALVVIALFGFLELNISSQRKRPNIVFIMGDDAGWFTIGAYME
jgi:hypothetical protein